MHLPIRPRRLRGSALLREMISDVRLSHFDVVAPFFICPGERVRKPVASMPDVFQMSADVAMLEIKELEQRGVPAFILFGVTDKSQKDAVGSHAHRHDNEVCRTLGKVKDAGIKMLAITDLCYCEYTNHGHCGPITPNGNVDNDITAERLGQQAVLHARAGADIIAPSGMMDGSIAAIRSALDADGKTDTAILSYAVKYASAYYGPFRDAADSAPQFGDRKTYQMDARRDNREAVREAQLDVEQGADMIMVKPGVAYLDVLRDVTQAVNVPTAVYQVSGEYSMIKAAAANGWVDEKTIVLETLTAFKRAGASFVLTYYAKKIAEWLA